MAGCQEGQPVMRNLLILALTGILGGCAAFSATTLRCGTDGESSYVELLNFPQDIGPGGGDYAEICSCSYEAQQEMEQ